MESVSTVSQEDFIFLLNTKFGANIVFRTLPYTIQPQHNTFISYRIKIINARIYFGKLRMARFFITGRKPKTHILVGYSFANTVRHTYRNFRVYVFQITSGTRRDTCAITHTQSPHTAERIIERRRTVI